MGMGKAPSTSRDKQRRKSPPPDKRDEDIEVLIKENADLRKLVTELTEPVIKNIVNDRSGPTGACPA